MNIKKFNVLTLVLFIVLTFKSHAALIMTLEGESGSSIVSFTLTGSAAAANSFDSSYRGLGIEIRDGFEPFSPLFDTFGVFDIISGSASYSNETRGESDVISGLWLQNSVVLGQGRGGVKGDFIFSGISVGDTLSWAGTGEIDLMQKGLSFDQLMVGTGLGDTDVLGQVSAMLVVKEKSSAISEPSTLFMLFLGLALFTRLRV